jgi:hypothetical protein
LGKRRELIPGSTIRFLLIAARLCAANAGALSGLQTSAI